MTRGDYRDDPRWQEAFARASAAKRSDQTADDALMRRLAGIHDMWLIECEYEAAA